MSMFTVAEPLMLLSEENKKKVEVLCIISKYFEFITSLADKKPVKYKNPYINYEDDEFYRDSDSDSDFESDDNDDPIKILNNSILIKNMSICGAQYIRFEWGRYAGYNFNLDNLNIEWNDMLIKVAKHTDFADIYAHDIEPNYPYYDFVIFEFSKQKYLESILKIFKNTLLQDDVLYTIVSFI
jgi:hypothetical protein